MITSDEYLQQRLNNLSVVINNSYFSEISWEEVGDDGGGIINSRTKLIGNNLRSGRTASLFSVILKNSYLSFLSGYQTSAIYTGKESLYSNIMLITNNNFKSIAVDSPGAIINPSWSPLDYFYSFFSEQQQLEVSPSFRIDSNNFYNITARNGAILSWTSAQKEISVIFHNNSLEKMVVYEGRGVFYMNDTNLVATKKALLNITNSSFDTIFAITGGILLAPGSPNLIQCYISDSVIQSIIVSASGGIVSTASTIFMIVSTTILSRRLLDSTTPGEVALSNNSFNKLSATDGGIIYDLSSNQTINILLVNNTIREVQVLKRGGIAYVNQPYLFMVNNMISSITAIVSGSVIYARSDKLLLINQHNKFENANFDTAFVFSPTNLKIEVFNLMDESLISLENYSDTLTSIPNLPNLTSYSLGQLRMTFTLVYAGASGVRTAIDESLNPGLILVFTHLNSNATPQVYPKSVCRGSVCTIVASTITLAGKAGDMYLVNATYESVAYALSQQFTITLRECIPGELNQTFTEQCVPCPQEKYSLQPNDTACSECPAGAKCLGGGNISIRKGYYRSPNATSLTILPCKDDGRCLGV